MSTSLGEVFTILCFTALSLSLSGTGDCVRLLFAISLSVLRSFYCIVKCSGVTTNHLLSSRSVPFCLIYSNYRSLDEVFTIFRFTALSLWYWRLCKLIICDFTVRSSFVKCTGTHCRAPVKHQIW